MPKTPDVPARIEKDEAAQAFVEWFCTPKQERDLSRTDLAEKTGVSRERLYQWQETAWFQNTCRHKVLSELAEERAEVYQALADEAKDGDIRAITQYSELMGDHVKQIDVTSGGESINTEDARMMTQDELIEQLIDEKIDKPGFREMLEESGMSKEQIGALLLELFES